MSTTTGLLKWLNKLWVDLWNLTFQGTKIGSWVGNGNPVNPMRFSFLKRTAKKQSFFFLGGSCKKESTQVWEAFTIKEKYKIGA